MITIDGQRTMDSTALRKAYGTFPSGVIAVSALRDGEPVGFAVSSFTSVSIDPPLVSVCPARTSETWPRLAECERLGLSVMGTSQGVACRQLASKSIASRLDGIGWQATHEGAVFLDDAAAWLDCSIHEVVHAGDHLMVLLRVEGFQLHDAVAPLVFHGSNFHQLTTIPVV